MVRVALRPFSVADHHVQVPLAAGINTRVRRWHQGERAKTQGLTEGLSPGNSGLAAERKLVVDVALDAADVEVGRRRRVLGLLDAAGRGNSTII